MTHSDIVKSMPNELKGLIAYLHKAFKYRLLYENDSSTIHWESLTNVPKDASVQLSFKPINGIDNVIFIVNKVDGIYYLNNLFKYRTEDGEVFTLGVYDDTII
jgi:hypothetical protein